MGTHNPRSKKTGPSEIDTGGAHNPPSAEGATGGGHTPRPAAEYRAEFPAGGLKLRRVEGLFLRRLATRLATEEVND